LHASARARRLLAIADDELILGWRDSEWTGVAPTLEEDVAFSSIAQNEIGHARALYELAAAEVGDTDADALAFDRAPDEYLCAPLVELDLTGDWAHTIARRYLYELADELRIRALMSSDDRELAGLAAKIDREEVYHRLHAELWAARLRDEPRFRSAVAELAPYALAVVGPELRPELARRAALGDESSLTGLARGEHTPGLTALWEQMTEVRRSVPGATW
jgi:ring-1,2-phenylacetyl-CoA epoxidase subunit PaaC